MPQDVGLPAPLGASGAFAAGTPFAPESVVGEAAGEPFVSPAGVDPAPDGVEPVGSGSPCGLPVPPLPTGACVWGYSGDVRRIQPRNVVSV